MNKKNMSAIRQRLADFFWEPLWSDYAGFRHSKFGTTCIAGFVGIVLFGAVIFPEPRPVSWVIAVAVSIGLFWLDAIIVTIGYLVRKICDFYWYRKEKSYRDRNRRASESVSSPQRLPTTSEYEFTMTADGPLFRLACRFGYETADVDDLIDQLETLPDTPEGHQAAYSLVCKARFPIARGESYDPAGVDDYFDWKLAELTTLLKAEDSTSPMTANGPRFRLAYRNGYDPSGVDDLIDLLEKIPDTPEGRRTAHVLVSDATFHLAKRNGYDPDEVDDYFDWKLAELTTLLKAEDSTSPVSTNTPDKSEIGSNLDSLAPGLGKA